MHYGDRFEQQRKQYPIHPSADGGVLSGKEIGASRFFREEGVEPRKVEVVIVLSSHNLRRRLPAPGQSCQGRQGIVQVARSSNGVESRPASHRRS